MIKNPVVYEGSHKELVDVYNATDRDKLNHNYWNDNQVDSIRSSIKRHYLQEQDYKCCYCGKQMMSNHGRVWDIEHIVAKSTHPIFLFEPENLAASCIDCNSAKGNTQVLVNSSVVRYPRRSEAFLIAHPHYDEISDHVGTFGDNFYWAKTRKGERTISICRLMRFGYEFLNYDEQLAGHEALVDTVFAYLGARDEVSRKRYFSQLKAVVAHEEAAQATSCETELTGDLDQPETSSRTAEVA